MPTSRPQVIGPALNLIMRKTPQSILDVGAGYGKWGMLLREYLEVWNGRLTPDQWKVRLDAVEVFAPYRELPWYSMFYNAVYPGDIRDYADTLKYYDIVLFGDVIEHMPKEDGQRLLDLCRDYVVITPNYDSGQGASFGNDHERHLSRWFYEDFPYAQVVDQRWIIGWRLE